MHNEALSFIRTFKLSYWQIFNLTAFQPISHSVIIDIMTDLFPEDPNNFKFVVNYQHVVRLLIEQIGEKGYNPFTANPSQLNNMKQRIRINCIKNCRASMTWVYNKEINIFELQTCNNQHSHKVYFKISVSSKEYGQDELYQSPQMKKNYEKYGKCLYVNVIQIKGVYILIFSGFNPSMEICIFGICPFVICSREKMVSAIKDFIANNPNPETVISMSEPIYETCKLYFNCVSIFCIDEVSQNLKIRQGIMKLLQETFTFNEWQIDFSRILMMISHTQVPSSLKTIFNQYKKFNFKNLPPSFVGLGVNIAHKEFVFQHLEEFGYKFGIDQRENWQIFLISVPKVFQIQLPEFQFEDITLILPNHVNSNAVSLQLSKKVSSYALKFILHQQYRVMYCDIVQTSKKSYLVSQKNQGSFTLNLLANSESQENKQIWQCSCRLIKKSGLPCCHLMKLLIRNGAISGCIEDYIDPFWVLLKTEEKVE